MWPLAITFGAVIGTLVFLPVGIVLHCILPRRYTR